MVSALHPQSRDLDNIMTTPYSSTNQKLINELKRTIKEVHGMDPNYSESDVDESHYAHPQLARNSTFSEIDNPSPPCQTPRKC